MILCIVPIQLKSNQKGFRWPNTNLLRQIKTKRGNQIFLCFLMLDEWRLSNLNQTVHFIYPKQTLLESLSVKVSFGQCISLSFIIFMFRRNTFGKQETNQSHVTIGLREATFLLFFIVSCKVRCSCTQVAFYTFNQG